LIGGDDEPTGWLRPVADNVTGMQRALVAGDVREGAPFADALVVETTRLLDAIDERHLELPPGRDRRGAAAWEAELISALRVYRNAAFVYRRMAAAPGGLDPALAAVCDAMIEQGHDHWRALTDEPPE
jgi:hypothetical protein